MRGLAAEETSVIFVESEASGCRVRLPFLSSYGLGEIPLNVFMAEPILLMKPGAHVLPSWCRIFGTKVF